MTRPLPVLVLLSGCACGPPPPPDVLVVPDAPTPCADYAARWDEAGATEALAAECGLCVPEDALTLAASGYGVVLVDLGLVLEVAERFVLVRPDGSLTWTPAPEEGGASLPGTNWKAYPVAGTRTFWAVNNSDPPMFGVRGTARVRLLRVEDDGTVTLVGVTESDRIAPAFTLSSGELVGNIAGGEEPFELLRIRARADGTFDHRTVVREDLGLAWLNPTSMETDDGQFVIATSARFDTAAVSQLARFDADLNETAAGIPLDIDGSDHGTFHNIVLLPGVGGGVVGVTTAGRMARVFAGTIDAAGRVVGHPRDGMIGTGSTGDYDFAVSATRFAAQWNAVDRVVTRWARLVDADGMLSGPATEIWRYDTGGLYVDNVVLDGAFRAYSLGTEPTSNWTTEEPYSQLTLERISEDLTTVWSAPRTFDACGDDVPQTWHGTFGDPAGGVWLVLRERQLDRNGYPVWLTRVHRIDETGVSRW